jgi:hypothetical protein
MVGESSRFCQQCGAPRSLEAAPVQQAAAIQMPASPRIIAMLPQARKMKMMGLYDTYTMVFTAGQIIFAILSNDVLKNNAIKAQANGKAEGKGFMRRMDDQVRSSGNVGERYTEMAPGQIVAESRTTSLSIMFQSMP